ncbi:MAG TPA: hypothetical protein VKY89_00455 [Thermoanaerobaculia bacterium]|nr:hypothetical protein [Thermoanaerobaculia bacterium]
MRSFPLAMPGALRLRSLQPLTDGDGSCSLVYDVERAAVFEVPEELKLYVAPALETGNLDEELLGWLASADLYTAESGWSWSGGELGLPPRRGWLDAAAPAQLPAPPYGGDEVHGWIDQPDAAAAIAAVERVFRRGRGSSRIKLHLDWAGQVPVDGRLETVVAEAGRKAVLSGQEVAFELVLEPEQATVEVARKLAALPVHVRLRCGECDPEARRGTRFENRPWLLAEPALQLLSEQMARLRPAPAVPPAPASVLVDLTLSQLPALLPGLPGLSRVTVQCVLDGPARLVELWRWARAAGVRSLDAIRLEDHDPAGPAGCGEPGRRAREYRQDLHTIFEETCDELEAGRSPVEFQPLIRIVRRLMCGEAAAAAGAGLAASGDGRPFAGFESLDPRLLPEQMWRCLEGPVESESPVPPCQTCWARQVCSHSAYVASPLCKEDPRDPSRECCAYWSAEVEMAARLFHRLSQIDALQVRRFFGDAPAVHPILRPVWERAEDGDALTSKPS